LQAIRIFIQKNMNLRKQYISVWMLFVIALTATAQIPAGYYQSATGKNGAQLKTTLYGIISSGFESKDYNFLYTIFRESDITADGKIWDMYSTCTWTYGTKQCGNYSSVCDCYNREHSIPASWFDDRSPMYSDAFHLYPTDGKVNGQRSNLPFGECANGTTLNNGKGRHGNSTYPGYSGTVFEPVDEYKGDFARTYFYFATRYENIMVSGISGASFNNTTYPAFTNWSKEMFLKWHRNDPVSQKEITRNNVIYSYQKNRNPFIDHPELAEHIWGNMVSSPWTIASVGSTQELSDRFKFNPAQKTFVFSAGATVQYRVLNVSGQTIRSGRVAASREVSVADLASGMYLVRFETEQTRAVRKFIIP
jgi:endonuclease I